MQAVTSHCSSFVAVPETWDGVAVRAGDAAAQEGSAAGWQMLNVMLWPTVPPTALWALPGFTWILPSLGDTSKRLNLPWVQAIPSPSLSLARHIHFSPCLLWSIFLLGWPLLQLLLPAPQAAVGRCCSRKPTRPSPNSLVAGTNQTCPKHDYSAGERTSACVHLSSVL